MFHTELLVLVDVVRQQIEERHVWGHSHEAAFFPSRDHLLQYPTVDELHTAFHKCKLPFLQFDFEKALRNQTPPPAAEFQLYTVLYKYFAKLRLYEYVARHMLNACFLHEKVEIDYTQYVSCDWMQSCSSLLINWRHCDPKKSSNMQLLMRRPVRSLISLEETWPPGRLPTESRMNLLFNNTSTNCTICSYSSGTRKSYQWVLQCRSWTHWYEIQWNHRCDASCSLAFLTWRVRLFPDDTVGLNCRYRHSCLISISHHWSVNHTLDNGNA